MNDIMLKCDRRFISKDTRGEFGSIEASLNGGGAATTDRAGRCHFDFEAPRQGFISHQASKLRHCGLLLSLNWITEASRNRLDISSPLSPASFSGGEGWGEGAYNPAYYALINNL
jgi:hypothetical protein